MKSIQNVPFSLDESNCALGRIGLIILATDHTIEHEFNQLLEGDHAKSLAFYRNRIRNDVTVTSETLADMQNRLMDAAETILPGKSAVDTYSCRFASSNFGQKLSYFSSLVARITHFCVVISRLSS